MSYVDNRQKFLSILSEVKTPTITSDELRDLCDQHSLKIPQWFTKDESNRVSRGVYKVPGTKATAPKSAPAPVTSTVDEVDNAARVLPTRNKLHIQTIATDIEEQGIVPLKYRNYVPFGNFDDVKAIILSRQFYPVFITGPSGNGKSMSVEQACAQLDREFICYSMTPETDETDLLGGYILLNNEMVWRDGPVTVAARRGAVLCLDEIDYGAQNLSTLQRVLEGKPFLLKKKGELVVPAPGFQIFATANTKGKGSEDGRYMYTNILNEAFLERFPITFEQEWAPNAVEKKIIKKELESVGCADDEFANHLVVWATTIRKAFDEAGVSEVISTRRLVHISKAYPIFNKDRLKAIQYCLNRFDTDTKKSFLDLYTKVDASVVTNNQMAGQSPDGAPTMPENV